MKSKPRSARHRKFPSSLNVFRSERCGRRRKPRAIRRKPCEMAARSVATGGKSAATAHDLREMTHDPGGVPETRGEDDFILRGRYQAVAYNRWCRPPTRAQPTGYCLRSPRLSKSRLRHTNGPPTEHSEEPELLTGRFLRPSGSARRMPLTSWPVFR
jgi:hypothetical protein